MRIFFSLLILLASCSKEQPSPANQQLDTPEPQPPDVGFTCILIQEPMPAFPGGFICQKAFLEKMGRPKGIPYCFGNSYVSFIVNGDGSLSDFDVLKSACKEYDAHVIEFLKTSPKWLPAIHEGKPVRQRMVLPVKFK